MRLTRLLIAAALWTLAAMPAKAATFGELESWCAPADAGGRPGLCSGYLETVLEGLASTDPTMNGGARVCVPAGADRGEVIRLLRAYARANPSSRDKDLTEVGQALKDRYPCG